MAYKIRYPSGKPNGNKSHTLRLQIITAAFLLAFVFCVRASRPEGAEILRDCLLPREPVDAQAAVQTLVDNLESGEAVPDAMAAFWQEILHGS